MVEDKLSPLFNWDPTTEERNVILNNISMFYNKYGEEPKGKGARENGNEAKMAAYLGQRRNNKKKGTLDIDIEKQICNALPWLKWDTKYTHILPIVRANKEVSTTNYTSMSKSQLIELCRKNNIIGYSHKTKSQLIDCLNNIKKDETTPKNEIIM